MRTQKEVEDELDSLRSEITSLKNAQAPYFSSQYVSEVPPAAGQVPVWSDARKKFLPSTLPFGTSTPGTWKLFYSDGSSVVTELALGSTSGQALVTNGAASAPSFAAMPAGMLKANAACFTYPTQPSAGTVCRTGLGGAFTTTPIQMTASTTAAIYIIGAVLNPGANAVAVTYMALSIMTGAGGSETEIWQAMFPGWATAVGEVNSNPVWFPILVPVPASTRIAVRTAASAQTTSNTPLVILIAVNQSDLVSV